MTSAPDALVAISPCLLLPLSSRPDEPQSSSHVLSNFRALRWGGRPIRQSGIRVRPNISDRPLVLLAKLRFQMDLALAEVRANSH